MTVCISTPPNIRTEPEEARVRTLAEPGDVREPVLRGRVEHAAEPRVRVEREHGHVRVRAREGGSVRGERGVVVADVLRIFGRDGGAEVVWGAVERRDVEKEVGPAQVVVVCVLLEGSASSITICCGREEAGVGQRTTAPKRDCISCSQKSLNSVSVS